MEKLFSFNIKVNGSLEPCSFYAPTGEGYVITNKYCPDELLVPKGTSFLSQAVVAQNGEIEVDFLHDCNNIVNKANTYSDNDLLFCLGNGANAVILEHVNRCGRLLFQDLLIYMDCLSYLLKSVGYTDAYIKQIYPIITKNIVDGLRQYVKESHTLLPFHVTSLYKTLCRLAVQ